MVLIAAGAWGALVRFLNVPCCLYRLRPKGIHKVHGRLNKACILHRHTRASMLPSRSWLLSRTHTIHTRLRQRMRALP